MKLWTYNEAKVKIQRDLDLTEETFITDDELLELFNDAIDEAEAEIHNLFEDYFLTEASITLVPGTDRYSLPTDIYANKVRNIWFNNGSEYYQIKRVRHKEIHNIEQDQYCRRYAYQIQHRTPSEGITIKFYPGVTHAGAYVHMNYIRNANRLALSTDLIDIPECMGYIFAHVKEKVCLKETHPLLATVKEDKVKQKDLLVNTLKSMTIDEDNDIDPDMSFYEDMN